MRTIKQITAAYQKLKASGRATQDGIARAMCVHSTTVGRIVKRGTANSLNHQRFDDAVAALEKKAASGKTSKGAKA